MAEIITTLSSDDWSHFRSYFLISPSRLHYRRVVGCDRKEKENVVIHL